jgi:hypothetical protein
MHSLLRAVELRRLVGAEAPALASSFVIAETFYKFHSFTLECLAFLATWYALGSLQRVISGRGP